MCGSIGKSYVFMRFEFQNASAKESVFDNSKPTQTIELLDSCDKIAIHSDLGTVNSSSKMPASKN